MPAITRSRLEEIRSLATEVTDAMVRGGGSGFADQVARLTAAVADVNTSLAEIDELLLAGLRDEAVSMHDPELVTVARLLDLRSRPDWVPLHGWLLERGQAPPAPVNLEAAELFAAVAEESEPLRDDLARLRRLELERAPLPERLSLIRRLRAADPASPVWIEMLAAHEDLRLRELRLALPRLLAAGDVDGLAELAGELADPAWQQPPPADLAPLAAGATEARQLAAMAAEAESIAAEVTRLMAGAGPSSPREIDAAAARQTRLTELRAGAEELVEILADHPRMLELVRTRGLDAAVSRAADEAGEALDRVRRLAAELKTRRDFAAACQRLEHLCDHPPQKGGEGKWLADLHRCDTVARAACQELPDLTMPALLKERLRRAATTVESREQLRRRFWVMVAAAAVVGLVAITAVAGWASWKWGEYARTLGELERRVAEARVGLHLERPADLERFASRHATDARVAALVEDFEAGVAAEKQRVLDFKSRLADHGEKLEVLAADVADRRAAGEDVWLTAWPPSFAAAAAALEEARSVGGLPEKRGVTADKVAPSAAARQRFQAEEDQLARAEARQADLGRNLDRLAQQAFDARLARLQDRMADAAAAADLRTLLADARGLRGDAAAPRADGLPNGGQRIPPEAVATLDALITKLQNLASQGKRGPPGASR